MKVLKAAKTALLTLIVLGTMRFHDTRGSELTVSGTKFLLDGKPFPFTGLSFFNAIYNPAFNATSETRVAWLQKFQHYGINVLRVWCQWDNKRTFVDASPTSTLYMSSGILREVPLTRLKALLAESDKAGMCVEVVLFADESFKSKRRLEEPADARAVEALTRELQPYRNAVFQIWNEHSDARVLPLLRVIKSIDPARLVTNSPGYPGNMGTAEENAALDFLSPHTVRQNVPKHWEAAPKQLAALLQEFHKPVVDDEPARSGEEAVGIEKGPTSPSDHILQIQNARLAGAYSVYHHDMFQAGYGTPSCPPNGIPDPEFSPYHKQVFEFLARREFPAAE